MVWVRGKGSFIKVSLSTLLGWANLHMKLPAVLQGKDGSLHCAAPKTNIASYNPQESRWLAVKLLGVGQ